MSEPSFGSYEEAVGLSDTCPCGRDASEAVGDPLQDHESDCPVFLLEAERRPVDAAILLMVRCRLRRDP